MHLSQLSQLEPDPCRSREERRGYLLNSGRPAPSGRQTSGRSNCTFRPSLCKQTKSSRRTRGCGGAASGGSDSGAWWSSRGPKDARRWSEAPRQRLGVPTGWWERAASQTDGRPAKLYTADRPMFRENKHSRKCQACA